MKILVTGGAGFIGSNYIRMKLAGDSDCEIVNLDKLTYCGSLDNLRDVERNSRYKFIKGDISDRNLVSGIINEEKPEQLINFAAESHVDNSISDPTPFVMTNVLGTNVLLDISRRNGVKRFLQISTDEVYGSIKEGSFNEDDSLSPNSPYSASKAGADLLVHSYVKTYGFPAIVVRLSNNFGPYQDLEKFIPLFVTNMIREKKVPLYGDGMNVREWIYVEDACKGIDKILREGEEGKIYNIGSGEEKANLEMAKFLEEKVGEGKEYIEFVEDRKGHDFRYSLDSSKIRNMGWSPESKLDESLVKTIQWYKDNEWWWKDKKREL